MKKIILTLALGILLTEIIYSDDSLFIYIADTYNHRLVRINDMIGTSWITWYMQQEDDTLPDVAVGPDGKIYFTTCNDHNISRIDDMLGTDLTEYGD